MAKVNGADPIVWVTLTRGTKAQRAIGDLLAVDFTQRATSPFWWALDIDACTTGGRYRVGSAIVRPPSYLGAAQGQQPGQAASRRVAYAWAPGAIEWRVGVRLLFVPPEGFVPPLTRRDAVAEINLASSENGGALGEPGVVGVDGFGRLATFSEKEWLPAVTLNGATPLQLTPSSGTPSTPLPGYVWRVYGEKDVAVVGRRWLQVFDSFLAPVNGDTPKWSEELLPGNNVGHFFRGLHCVKGPWVAVSTTGPTLTLAGAAEAFFQAEWEITPRLAVNP